MRSGARTRMIDSDGVYTADSPRDVAKHAASTADESFISKEASDDGLPWWTVGLALQHASQT